MRRNEEVDWSSKGRYSTTVFTEEAEQLLRRHPKDQPLFLFMAHLAPHAGNYEAPLQAPASLIRRFKHIANHERRVYAGNLLHLCKYLQNDSTCVNPDASLPCIMMDERIFYKFPYVEKAERRKVQWATTVMTPASIRNTREHGS